MTLRKEPPGDSIGQRVYQALQSDHYKLQLKQDGTTSSKLISTLL
ncbi:MAG: hypothetical protein ACJ71H_14110 [Nitrososphaeraceae archaeon]